MKRVLASFLIIAFSLTSLAPAKVYAQGTVLGLPEPGTMVELSPAFAPVLMKGLRIHPENPLLFDFIIDTGHSGLTVDTPQLRAESEKLIKYFLATLTIPEKDLWVNLSPYEKDRIVPGQLGQTEMGRDMLAQDYMLKQLTASMIYPEKEMGKKFWDKVYAQARQAYGNTDIPVNTFNKVWILPDKAGIFVRGNTAYVVEGHLKVMLEEDYLAKDKHQETKSSTASSKIVREIVLPEIEREVNSGKNFAPLRQIFYSLVLASWYKKNLKAALLNQVYSDKDKINGVDANDRQIKEKIYQQYLAAYKKGVFNYIKEDASRLSKQPIPRKYFSGGEVWKDMAMTVYTDPASPVVRRGAAATGQMFEVGTRVDAAMAAGAQEALQTKVSTALAEALPAIDTAQREFEQRQGDPQYDPDKLVSDLRRIQGGLSPLNEVLKSFQGDPRYSSLAQQVFTAVIRIRALTQQVRSAGTLAPADAAMTVVEVGYNNDPLSKPAQDIITDYRTQGVLFLDNPTIEATVIESKQETFGITAVADGQGERVYVERPFLTRVLAQSNSQDILSRAVVYAKADGTHEQKRMAEFEYARKLYGDDRLKQMLGADYVGLYDYFIGQLRQNSDEQMKQDIARRFKESLWEIAINHLNGDVRNVRVRTTADDKELGNKEEDKGDAHVVYFALAANPLHYGQVETALRAMAQSKASQVVFRVQGLDFRKPITGATNKDRHEITDGFAREISKFAPSLFAYSAIGRNNDLDGETDYLNFLKINAGRKGKLRVDYLVGSDHMHYYAPDYKGPKDTDGNFQPKKDKDGKTQADTIQKFDQFTQANADFLKANNMQSVVLFNERDPKESKPMPVEEETLQRLKEQGLYVLLRGINLEGASSTLIRNALAGFGEEADLTIMPAYVEQQIKERGQYRGFIIELPSAIKRLAAAKPEKNDKNILANWLDVEQARGKTPTAEGIAAMFSLSDAPLSGQDVQKAIDALGRADQAMAVETAKDIKLLQTRYGWLEKRLALTGSYQGINGYSRNKQSIADALARQKEALAAITSPAELSVAVQLAGNMEDRLNTINNVVSTQGQWENWAQQEYSLADLNPDMFRDYDYRNTGPFFSPKMGFILGLTWAKMAIEKAEKAGIPAAERNVLVARDARKIESELTDALVAALRFAGLNVIYVGADPNTVTSYSWAVQRFKPMMSIFETASHVSQPEGVVVRGFKVAMRTARGGNILSLNVHEIKKDSLDIVKGMLADPSRIKAMESAKKGTFEVFRQIEASAVQFNTLIGHVASANGSLYELGEEIKANNDPQGFVAAQAKQYADNKPLQGQRVVIDGAFTPSGLLAAQTFENLGAEVIKLNTVVREVSGLHKADPSVDANLKELKDAMQKNNATFGLAFDLDGDRGAILVPEIQKGTVTGFKTLAQDNLIGMVIPSLIERWGYKNIPGKKLGVIKDVLGTMGIVEKSRQVGVETFTTDTGYVFLKAKKEALEKQNYVVPIYGERSGHGWLHATGEIENPVAIAVLFALIVKEKMDAGIKDALSVYDGETIPFSQSPRFQPPIHPNLLKKLSDDPRNDTGWKYDPNSTKNPPQKIIALARHETVKAMEAEFTPGKVFSTVAAGPLHVKEFNVDKGENIDGLYRYADVVFVDDAGAPAGHFVMRASSNDPSFVASYEAPLGNDQKRYAAGRRIAIAGIVTLFLAQGYALFAPDQMSEVVFTKANLGPIHSDMVKSRSEFGISQDDYAMLSTEGNGIGRDDDETPPAASQVDNAQTAKETRGGIDFNAENLPMDVSGDAIDIRFDQSMIAQFKRGDFTGVRPVILSVTPLSSVLPLLGIPSASL